ncbi:unnamed protein product [Fusarium venenatum]|uniref:Uncharacterized protein n=1 Tax=Fusarium venenatum TaxID=56646 RepID=A0A2L2T9W4_9HYPO|nr:uncharacterized protein FVRRES_01235 [Fusarium venenatum]CEI64723.1 unnamed protein product [Fusarium venenatum]
MSVESLESRVESLGDVQRLKSLRKRGVSVSGAVPAFAGEAETETQRSRNCLLSLPSQGERLFPRNLESRSLCLNLDAPLSRVISCGVKVTAVRDVRYPLRRRRRPSFYWSHSNH